MRTHGRRRVRSLAFLGTLAVAVIGASAASAVLDGAGALTSAPAPAREARPATGPATATSATAPPATAPSAWQVTEAQFASALRSWSSARLDQGYEVERYGSLEEMTTWASAVVIADVVTVDEPYVFESEELGFDRFEVPRATLGVREVLSGTLPGDPATVTTYWPGFHLDADLAEAGVPLLLFLRDYADPHGPDAGYTDVHPVERGAHRVVSRQGLFVPTPAGAVLAPALDAGDPVLQDLRERDVTMEELVSLVTEIGRERQVPWPPRPREQGAG